ncbi:MAG: hypothetical protein ACE5SW_13555 [Nitrososphaeraceae archaeon]
MVSATNKPSSCVPSAHISISGNSKLQTISRSEPGTTRCPSNKDPTGQTSGQFPSSSTIRPVSGQVNFLGLSGFGGYLSLP